jgi:hypothetical protein
VVRNGVAITSSLQGLPVWLPFEIRYFAQAVKFGHDGLGEYDETQPEPEPAPEDQKYRFGHSC